MKWTYGFKSSKYDCQTYVTQRQINVKKPFTWGWIMWPIHLELQDDNNLKSLNWTPMTLIIVGYYDDI
jgi:hypothetical protein